MHTDTAILGTHPLLFSVAQLFSVMSQGQLNVLPTSKGYASTTSLGTCYIPRDTQGN